MKRHCELKIMAISILLFGLIMAGAALVFGASGGTIPQQLDYSAFVPRSFGVDPNALYGCVLPWNAGDPNDLAAWTTVAGHQLRTGRIYDAESLDYIQIRGMPGSPAILGSVDPNAGTWTIEVDLTPGVQTISMCVDDPLPEAPLRRRLITLVVNVLGPKNTTPVVE